MGFLRSLLGGQPASASTKLATPAASRDAFDGPPPPWRQVDHVGSHAFMNVVGESHYQQALGELSTLFELIGRDDRNFAATLAPEPTNAHDPTAVAVRTDSGATLGYLPRDVAHRYHESIAAQPGRVRCWAQLCGGTEDAPAIGVVLDFEPIYALTRGAAPAG